MTSNPEITVRPTRSEDAALLATLLNEVIERGGTTAFQKPLSAVEFTAKFIDGPGTVSCLVACLCDGTLMGFQYLQTPDDMPDNWGDIATFAKIDSPVRGVGTTLFQATLDAARQAGLTAINAKIRADNVPGLGYYAKMGFVDYAVAKAVPLSDGTPVDRISKKYLLK